MTNLQQKLFIKYNLIVSLIFFHAQSVKAMDPQERDERIRFAASILHMNNVDNTSARNTKYRKLAHLFHPDRRDDKKAWLQQRNKTPEQIDAELKLIIQSVNLANDVAQNPEGKEIIPGARNLAKTTQLMRWYIRNAPTRFHKLLDGAPPLPPQPRPHVPQQPHRSQSSTHSWQSAASCSSQRRPSAPHQPNARAKLTWLGFFAALRNVQQHCAGCERSDLYPNPNQAGPSLNLAKFRNVTEHPAWLQYWRNGQQVVRRVPPGGSITVDDPEQVVYPRIVGRLYWLNFTDCVKPVQLLSYSQKARREALANQGNRANNQGTALQVTAQVAIVPSHVLDWAIEPAGVSFQHIASAPG